MAGIGIMIEGQEGLNWERWRHLCAKTEELHFDSLWRSDHYYSVLGVPGRDCIETWVSLALAAEWTRGIEFGPLVSSMTFRQPELLARMAASVDALAGGRLVLGVGAGWYQVEHEMFSIPYPGTRERLDRLEDGVRRIRETWEKALPAPPRGSIPILVGGAGEKRTLRLVAQEAAEWNCYGLDPEAYAAKLRVLLDHCREVGRDPATIRRSLMTSFLIGRDRDDIAQRALRLGQFLPDYAGLGAQQVIEKAARRWPVGTPEEVAEWLRPYLAQGVSRFMFQHYLMDDDDALQLLSQVARHLT